VDAGYRTTPRAGQAPGGRRHSWVHQ
jgi:hypothetical protein